MLTTNFTRTTTGDLTFSFFFTKFINAVLCDDIYTDSKLFNVRVNNNDLLFLQKFETDFPKFNLKL